MTPDEERRGAELFAAGKSEREVAKALDVSPSSAHRLRERLDAASGTVTETKETPVDGDAGDDSGVRDEVDEAMRAELLAQLRSKHDEMTAQLTDLAERANASRTALAELEAERLALLDAGQDAAPLRPRVASATADLADWETAGSLLQQRIAAVGQRATEVMAEQQLADLRSQLAPAVAERDAAVRSTGDRMATAVLAVKAAAEEFIAALADEQAARDRAELLAAQVASLAGSMGQPGPDLPAEPESTILPSRWDQLGGHMPIDLAIQAANAGRPPKTVAGHLADADGELPPTREEQAAEQARMHEAWMERDRQMRQPKPAPQPWTRPDTSSVDVDANGREVWVGYRPPLPPGPQDHLFGLYR
jgi:hypothetical protein